VSIRKVIILYGFKSSEIFDSKFIERSEGPLFYLSYIVAICRGTQGMKAAPKPQVNREGKVMMFLIRTAFWLIVLVLLLPTDEDQQKRIYGTAQAAVNDIAQFCDRNPQTCATGQDAFAVLVQKAQYGAHMVQGLVEGKAMTFGSGIPGPVATTDDAGVMPVPAAMPFESASWDAEASQDTLSPEDREAAWGGPGI
jgi:Family of unknown function (DUF5330)